MKQMENVIENRMQVASMNRTWFTPRTFLESISDQGNRIVFQLHSDPENVFRSASLGGARPHIHQVLDALAESIGRNLKFVYDYEGHRYKIGFADYVK